METKFLAVIRNRQIYLAGSKLADNELITNQPNEFVDYI